MTTQPSVKHSRRTALLGLGGGVGLLGQSLTVGALLANSSSGFAQGMFSGRLRSFNELMEPVIGGATPIRQNVSIKMPLLADNGNLVGMEVSSTLAMREDNYVEKIYLLSQRNPVACMAVFYLGPWSGEARINTRVRLAGSQMIVAVAKTSKDEYYYDQFDVVVTESACVDGT